MRLPVSLLLVSKALLLSSCGYSIAIQSNSTTSSSSIPSTSSTTTTIDYGDACTASGDRELQKLINGAGEAWEKAVDGDGTPTDKESSNLRNAMVRYRSFVREANLPTMSDTQSDLVDAIQDFLIALNDYEESGSKDLSVNDMRIVFMDAESDFIKAWNEVCTKT